MTSPKGRDNTNCTWACDIYKETHCKLIAKKPLMLHSKLCCVKSTQSPGGKDSNSGRI